jgi:hypothetical protein
MMNPKMLDEVLLQLNKEVEQALKGPATPVEPFNELPPTFSDGEVRFCDFPPPDPDKIARRTLSPDKYALWLMGQKRDQATSDELRKRNDELDRETTLIAKRRALLGEDILDSEELKELSFDGNPFGGTVNMNDLLRMELLGANKLFLVALGPDGRVEGSVEIVKAADLSSHTNSEAKQSWYKRVWTEFRLWAIGR